MTSAESQNVAHQTMMMTTTVQDEDEILLHHTNVDPQLGADTEETERHLGEIEHHQDVNEHQETGPHLDDNKVLIMTSPRIQTIVPLLRRGTSLRDTHQLIVLHLLVNRRLILGIQNLSETPRYQILKMKCGRLYTFVFYRQVLSLLHQCVAVLAIQAV